MLTEPEAIAYLAARGIVDDDLIEAAKLGYTGGRVTMPWIDASGAIIYSSGRATDPEDEPRYLHSKGPRPALFATPGAWQAQTVCLVEGQLDALAAAQAGTAAFATSGSTLSEEGAALLRTCKTVILVPDADPAGARWRESVVTQLGRYTELREVILPEAYGDLADLASAAPDPAEDVAKALAAAELIVIAPGRFEVLSARLICAIDAPGGEQLLGPMIVRGHRVVIGAHSGQGKTTIALQAIGSIVGERDFLGWKGLGGRALFIDAEQGLRSLQRRLREAHLDNEEAIDILRLPDGLTLDKSQDERAHMDKLLAKGEYSVVVIDPLYKLHSGDSNDERQAVDLMKLFDKWREEYGFAFILPVHCRKPPPLGAKLSMHEFFGSSAYLRGAEVVVGIEMIRYGYSKLHWFKDRDGDLEIGKAWGMVFSHAEGFRRDPNEGPEARSTTEKIRDVLTQTPGMTKAQIAAALELSPKTIARALKGLGITSEGGNQWTAARLWLPQEADGLEAYDDDAEGDDE